MGPKWTFSWMRFVQEVPMDAFGVQAAHVWVSRPPGGREVFHSPDAQGVFPQNWHSRASLVRVSESPVRYERRLPDGTIEVYALSTGAPSGQRTVLMTELIDPHAQRLQFTWDAQLRLVAITDAVGQVTTLEYAHPADALKLTAVQDPYGRRATFTYNAAGQLASSTDVLGLTTSFTYGANDFVSTLTTPYGTTTFRHEPNESNLRFIEATDPLGGTEHLEFQYETPTLPATAPVAEVPAGFTGWNTSLDHWNTFYWNKRAWAAGKNDLSKATITHWMYKAEFPGDSAWSSVPHSVKRPLEARVWYAYPGQVAGQEHVAGWFQRPSRVGRVLDDGTSQITETTYNTFGLPLIVKDPLGRETTYSYDVDGVTLTQVRQTTGGINDVLATYSNFDLLKQPQTMTDAAGQTTTTTYNNAGQVLTVTNANNETTTWTYTTDGQLTNVLGPVAGATTTYTYDGYGRVRIVTDPDNYTITTDYDLFDRPIRTTYPDGTYDETTYDRLNVSARRDRAGRVTRYYYDALQRLTATRDPAGRVIGQEWCACGSLDALVDANGNRTRWERDLHGRVTREVRADGVTATVYTYQPRSGRLATATDPKQQVTTYAYNLDDALASTTYTNAVIATPGVSYTYDTQYGRLATMTDGIGLTTYTYHPAGQLGAGQVASVDGPLTDDTITYGYDQLGRVTKRAINGAANTVTWAFDALGRVTSEVNLLGTFTYTYDGVASRVATVTYPNGQTSAYSYYDNLNDRRLQTIHHKYPNGTTLSKFDYAYDAAGNILTWRQQADNDAVLWSYGYDAADQLTSAIKAATDPQQKVLKRYAYAYDQAGNRTMEQIDDQVTGATYDNLNRLVSQQPSGAMLFAGTVSEPASVTMQGVAATVTAAHQFQATVAVTQGTNTVSARATDRSGNSTTQQYEVDSTGTGRTFTYDANGNRISDENRTFEWDAADRLTAVVTGYRRTEFTYDGTRRAARVVVVDQAVILDSRRLVWCELSPCEQRDPDGLVVGRRLLGQGEQVAALPRFSARDQLRVSPT
jgi:YD repeat-containing protein